MKNALASRCKSLQIAGIRSPGVARIPNDHRLDGWKAIANFLGRERSTAIRWANERGLPVHRVPGGRTGTVYAIPSELEAWLSSDRHDEGAAGNAGQPTVAKGPSLEKRALTAASVAAVALVALLAILWWRATPSTDAPVTVAAVASPTASPDTLDFARGLNADLARFANASPTLAVFEREPGVAPGTQYAVRTEIERADGKMIATARLIALSRGQVIWSRRFEQAGPALSALRAQVAANIVNVLRCSFGGLENERSKARTADLEQLMAICQNFEDNDMSAALARARRLTLARPDLAFPWAMLANIQGNMVGAGDVAAQPQAVANRRRAAAIAPDNIATWLARAAASGDGPTGPKALPVIDEALRRHPDQTWLLSNRSVILFNLGYVKASVADVMNAVRNDPSSFDGRDIAVRRLAAAGRTQEAQALQTENERLWPDHPLVIENAARIATSDVIRHDADVAAIGRYERDFAAKPYVAYPLARFYERTGNRRAALAWLARAPVKNALQQWSTLFWPDAAGLRAEPAFFHKMAGLGLVRWWVARKAWPDFCAEPGLKYDCADEARKLRLTN